MPDLLSPVPPRVALLLRVSTQSQAEGGSSLETQNARLTALCEAEGMILIERVLEAGVSGRLDERPGIRRLLELAEARLIDVILAVKIDRLARNLGKQEQWLHQFQRLGVEVRFADMSFAPTPTGTFLRQVVGGMAELESSIIAERTLSGRKAKAAAGRLPSHVAPFGYRQVSTAEAAAVPEYKDRGGELLILEEEAGVVRALYREYLAGRGLNALALWLNEQGAYRRPGVRAWHVSHVKRILEHPVYKGEYPYGAAGAWGPPIPVPAIVDAETWEQVQERRAGVAARLRGQPSVIWMLRGVLFCGECPPRRDHPPYEPLRLRGTRGTNRKKGPAYEQRYYICTSTQLQHRDYCGVRMPAGRIEAKAKQVILGAVEPGELTRLIKARQAALAETVPGNQRARLVRELEKTNAGLRRLADLALEGVLPADTLAEKAAELTARRQALEQELGDTTARTRRTQRLGQALAEAEGRARYWRELLARDEPEWWQQAAQEFLRVTLYREREPDWETRVPGIDW
jgi:site-specific DNA recombinase